MWNFLSTRAMGHTSPMLAPNFGQKRNFHLLPDVAIVPGKEFRNPNYVNKSHSSVHNYQQKFGSSHEKHCQIDNIKKDSNLKDSSAENSSRSTKESMDIVVNQLNDSEATIENSSNSHSEKSKEKNRNRRRKMKNKKSKHKNQREMCEMMEEDGELDNCDITDSKPSNPLHMGGNKDSQDCSDYNCDNSDIEFTLGSISPQNNICFLAAYLPRKRESSITESEDSFIVFDSGTDDELYFSERSEEDSSELEDNDSVSDEESECEIEEDLDSSSSVIPSKRVRFVDDSELCEIHPMVQWAYAYKQARKGPWEVYARDRSRFKRRVDETETVLLPILDCEHRAKVYNERFRDTEMC